MTKKLYRSNSQKIFGGVAGGIGEYFDIDPVLVRVLFLILIFGYGISLLAYIVMWIIVPISPYYQSYDMPMGNPVTGNPTTENPVTGNPETGQVSSEDTETDPNQAQANATNEFYQQNPYYQEAEQKDSHNSSQMKKFFGVILIVVGGLIFIDEVMPNFDFDFVFPLLLVATGGYILMHKNRDSGDAS
jgi:phage shock protein C